MRYSFYDFVVPKNNEDVFCSIAKKLGYSGIFFCYSFEEFSKRGKEIDKGIGVLKDKFELDIFSYVLCEREKNIEKAKKLNKNVLFLSNKECDVRNLVQKFKPCVITNLEFQNHDFMHHRAGINQVIAISMRENNVSYGISLNLIFSSKYKAEIIGRMKQNVRLAKKYSVPIKFFTLSKDPYKMKGPLDIVSFAVFLGINPGQAKRCLDK